MNLLRELRMNLLTPGRYRLKIDVPNPALDRRARIDWRESTPVIAAGTEFFVNEYLSPERSEVVAHALYPTGQHYTYPLLLYLKVADRADKEPHDKLARLLWALLPHLERVGDELYMPSTSERIGELVMALRLVATTLDRIADAAASPEFNRIIEETGLTNVVSTVLAKHPPPKEPAP